VFRRLILETPVLLVLDQEDALFALETITRKSAVMEPAGAELAAAQVSCQDKCGHR